MQLMNIVCGNFPCRYPLAIINRFDPSQLWQSPTTIGKPEALGWGCVDGGDKSE
jgi:hypothetical protein